MSEYVTDPEILRQLQGSSEPAESEYVTDPAILQQLSGGAAIGETAKAPEGSVAGSAVQAIAPAAFSSQVQPVFTPATSLQGPELPGQVKGSFSYQMKPTGLKELGQAGVQAAKPFAQSAVGPTAAIYKAHPLLAPAVDAIGLGTVGFPPVAGTQSALGLYDKYKGVQAAGSEASKFLSESEKVANPTTGRMQPATQDAYRAMQKAGGPEVSAKLTELWGKNTPGVGGGNNAVSAWLSGPEGQAAMKDPKFAAAANEFMGKTPGVMGQVGRVVGPVARGAARVAGPVGMGMSLYDAGQMARETQLGERLAQGQGRMAQNAFRSGMGMTYQGPQLAPQEAQNVLQSGSQRDIQYFGGQDRLKEMIRKKAAEKVLGPVAPGSF